MTNSKLNTIPLPLVRTNQWTIFISVILTWITGLYWLLLIPLISGLCGLLFDFHPILKFAKQFLKKEASSYPQEDKVQQNFNQTIAITCLSLAFIGAVVGWPVLFLVFSIMVALASFIAINGFCIGCFIHFKWSQYKYRKSLR